MFGGIFDKLKSGLSKTKSSFTDKVSEILRLTISIDDDMYDELEELLITADMGMDTTVSIIDKLKKKLKKLS
jgi:signal recognition particle-docking protein FtsY